MWASFRAQGKLYVVLEACGLNSHLTSRGTETDKESRRLESAEAQVIVSVHLPGSQPTLSSGLFTQQGTFSCVVLSEAKVAFPYTASEDEACNHFTGRLLDIYAERTLAGFKAVRKGLVDPTILRIAVAS